MSINFEKYSRKLVWVTGASGFIGPHLCRALAEADAQVLAISRNPGEGQFEGIRNIEQCAADLSKSNEIEKLKGKGAPDVVFHLAGLAAGGREKELVDPTFKSNFLTTLNLLEAFAEGHKSRLVLIGSMEEPAPGETDFVPSSPYAASKYAAGMYGRMFHELYRTNLVIARLFMTYGPGNQPEKKLLPYVINTLLEDESPRLGSGSRLIDWIYIDDVVEALMILGQQKNIQGQTIDIGSGTLVSISDFVGTIRSIIGSHAEPDLGMQNDRQKEQEKKANIVRTFEQTGWNAKTDLITGLSKTIDWYRMKKSSRVIEEQ